MLPLSQFPPLQEVPSQPPCPGFGASVISSSFFTDLLWVSSVIPGVTRIFIFFTHHLSKISRITLHQLFICLLIRPADLPRPVLPENDTAGAAGIHFSAAHILAQPPEPQICNTPKNKIKCAFDTGSPLSDNPMIFFFGLYVTERNVQTFRYCEAQIFYSFIHIFRCNKHTVQIRSYHFVQKRFPRFLSLLQCIQKVCHRIMNDRSCVPPQSAHRFQSPSPVNFPQSDYFYDFRHPSPDEFPCP